MVVLFLLAPFAITAFLADATNILVEEGYSYSFLAVAVALLFFGWPLRRDMGLSRALLFAVAVDGLYLSKSGMLPVVVALVVGFLLMEERGGLRWLVVTVIILAAPVGWALHQHHASGQYSVGNQSRWNQPA